MDSLDPISLGIPRLSGPPGLQIAAIVQRQYGVLSTQQLRAAGLSSATITEWVAAGHLHRLRRGVYAVGRSNVAREGQFMAAVLVGGAGAVLSHTSAARHLGLDRTQAAGTIHLSLPRSNKRQPRGILVHRPRSLEPIDVTKRFSIPTTTATRTLFDLTASLSANELRKRFERAEFLEILDRARLRALLAGSTGHKGLGNLRTLAGYKPLPLSRIRSRLEGIILLTCRTYSLPLPAVNVPLLDYEVDFLWPEAHFVVEADGGQHRGEQRSKDNERDVTLARAGYLVRRYSEEVLGDERSLAAEIRDILRERLSREP